MSDINEATTKQVAHLARLKLTNQEVKDFTAQLNDILAYVAKNNEVNVDGVEPMVSPHEYVTPLREDVAILFSKDGENKILAAAPDVVNDGFKVPKII